MSSDILDALRRSGVKLPTLRAFLAIRDLTSNGWSTAAERRKRLVNFVNMIGGLRMADVQVLCGISQPTAWRLVDDVTSYHDAGRAPKRKYQKKHLAPARPAQLQVVDRYRDHGLIIGWQLQHDGRPELRRRQSKWIQPLFSADLDDVARQRILNTTHLILAYIPTWLAEQGLPADPTLASLPQPIIVAPPKTPTAPRPTVRPATAPKAPMPAPSTPKPAAALPRPPKTPRARPLPDVRPGYDPAWMPPQLAAEHPMHARWLAACEDLDSISSASHLVEVIELCCRYSVLIRNEYHWLKMRERNPAYSVPSACNSVPYYDPATTPPQNDYQRQAYAVYQFDLQLHWYGVAGTPYEMAKRRCKELSASFAAGQVRERFGAED